MNDTCPATSTLDLPTMTDSWRPGHRFCECRSDIRLQHEVASSKLSPSWPDIMLPKTGQLGDCKQHGVAASASGGHCLWSLFISTPRVHNQRAICQILQRAICQTLHCVPHVAAACCTQADFLPLAIEFPANYLTIAARLPAYNILAGTSLHAHLTVRSPSDMLQTVCSARCRLVSRPAARPNNQACAQPAPAAHERPCRHAAVRTPQPLLPASRLKCVPPRIAADPMCSGAAASARQSAEMSCLRWRQLTRWLLLQYTGAGAAPFPIEGQTEVQALVADVVPQLLAARITNITEAASGDYVDVELQVNTAHQNGTFTPKVTCGSSQCCMCRMLRKPLQAALMPAAVFPFCHLYIVCAVRAPILACCS